MNMFGRMAGWLDAIPYWFVALFLRIVVAHPFFVSGQTKIDGPTYGTTIRGVDLHFKLPTSVRDATVSLFEDEYKVPHLSPELGAYLSSIAENLLPVLLVLGLATRLSALGLLIMTLIIQFFVYPEAWWTAHAYWAAILLVLVARGAGALSLDHLLFRKTR